MLKTVQFWARKLFSEIVENEIASLRHFLPRPHFFWTFGYFFLHFLGASWDPFWVFWGFLVYLWTQNVSKTKCFLRFLKGVSEAFLVSFGLSLLCCSVELDRNRGPKCVPKLHLEVLKFLSSQSCKKSKNPWINIGDIFEQIWHLIMGPKNVKNRFGIC